MVQFFLGLGSNYHRAENMQQAVESLDKKFGILKSSSLYESASTIPNSENYYNRVVSCQTDISLQELSSILKGIEQQQGRDRSQRQKVSIDIDLLLFGGVVSITTYQTLPHPDILTCLHVLKPLNEIASDLVHPQLGKTLSEIYSDFCEKNLKEDKQLVEAVE